MTCKDIYYYHASGAEDAVLLVWGTERNVY